MRRVRISQAPPHARPRGRRAGETARAAFYSAGSSAAAGAALGDVFFLQPLAVGDEAWVECALAVGGGFEVRSRQAEGQEELEEPEAHCSGRAAAEEAVGLRAVGAGSAQRRCATAADAGALYSAFAAVGLAYGPAFRTLEAAWAGEVHACAVCFDEKAAVDCVRFHSCGHTFCKGCIAGYFQSQVADGAVAELLCPEPSCRAAATPAEVKAVLSEEDYEAFERLSLQQSLQSMKDVFVCPRCEYPAILQEEGGRLAICGECHFSFCVECRCAWHGLSACANLAARWRKAGPAERDALTAKYGAKMVEEVQSAELIEGTTKPCVNCGTPIEKNGGCNHITCRHCRYQWCWLCGQTYKPGPYKNGPCEQFYLTYRFLS